MKVKSLLRALACLLTTFALVLLLLSFNPPTPEVKQNEVSSLLTLSQLQCQRWLGIPTYVPRDYKWVRDVDGPPCSEEGNKLTVVVMGYDRVSALQKVVCNYAVMGALVSKILVVWNNPDLDPPSFASSSLCESCFHQGVRATAGSSFGASSVCTSLVDVQVFREQQNTLLNRYKHWKEIKTCAVLLTDDDIVLCSSAIERMLELHRQHPEQVIGIAERHYSLVPRNQPQRPWTWSHFVSFWKKRDTAPDAPTALPSSTAMHAALPLKFEYSHAVKGVYSLTTGQANLVPRDFMKSYLSTLPWPILRFINSHHPTCEDLTLHFHVSNSTSLPPIHLHVPSSCAAKVDSKLGMHGQESAHSWHKKRAACLERLTCSFGRLPLVSSDWTASL